MNESEQRWLNAINAIYEAEKTDDPEPDPARLAARYAHGYQED